jgi:eukaryotic-like serine/threonine-protein kinase
VTAVTESMAPGSRIAEGVDGHRPPADPTRTSPRSHAPVLAEVSVLAQLRDPSRYRILGEHGRGGLGRVTRAHDLDLGRDVAIKELISRGPVSEVRFLREALITARLEHPGIVPVYEAGRWPDGTPFYAMKLVAGRPLRDLIAERSTIDERIGLLHHVIAVADAIAYVHDRNIIHRDLKPSNVIVGDYGETVVIDWGLAKDLSSGEQPTESAGQARIVPDAHLTSAGTVLGTPAYMAPEQARGEAVDQRADVFAIGAMLWELCSLEPLPPAFTGFRNKILRGANIDRDLTTIIEKAIDPNPHRRYADAGALAADLKAFKVGARIGARRYSLWALLGHWIRRNRRAAMTVAIAMAASSAGIALYVHRVSSERARAEAAQLAMQDATVAAAAADAEKQLANARAAQAALEQGRAALLHQEPEAFARLMEAYKREQSPATAFMLARAIQPRLQQQALFSSTFGRMWSAMFSPDGTQVITTDDRAAQIWDRRTHQLRWTLPHGFEVYQAVYTHEGVMLVTVGLAAVKIWDPTNGVLLRELHAKDHSKAMDYFRVAISADGQFVAAIDSAGGMVNVWNIASGDLVAELHGVADAFPALAFGPDRWLAMTGGHEVQVFDTRTWARVATLPVTARRLAFNSHSLLVTGDASGDVILWEVPSGARHMILRKSGKPVEALAFSPDERLIASGDRDGIVQVWHTETGVLRSQLNPQHSKILELEFDATAKFLLAAHSNGTVAVADVAQGSPVALLEGPGNSVLVAHFDPSGTQIVGASWDGRATLWNAGPPYRRWMSEPATVRCPTVKEVQSRYVVVACGNQPIKVWDTARDLLLAEIPTMTRVAIVSPDGGKVALARDNAVEVRELPGGRLVRVLDHGAPVTAIAFAPNGLDLISGAADGSLLISRGDETRLTLRTQGRVDALVLLADGRAVISNEQRHLEFYAPDGALLADLMMATRTMALRPHETRVVAVPNYLETAAPPILLDLQNYKVVAELAGHVGNVNAVRWISDWRILTAGGDATVRMWDGASGRPLGTYHGGAKYLADATLLNESVVIAGDGDGVLWFWDLSTASRLWTMRAHESAIQSLHMQGDDLITRGLTAELSRWRLPSAEQVIDECRRRPNCANASE